MREREREREREKERKREGVTRPKLSNMETIFHGIVILKMFKRYLDVAIILTNSSDISNFFCDLSNQACIIIPYLKNSSHIKMLILTELFTGEISSYIINCILKVRT